MGMNMIHRATQKQYFPGAAVKVGGRAADQSVQPCKPDNLKTYIKHEFYIRQ